MNSETGKILLTGVCYVHRLLQIRFDKSGSRNHIDEVHPDFDTDNVLFFNEKVSDRFYFADFHNQFSSIDVEANGLPEILNAYEPMCDRMYIVGATNIASYDLTSLKPEDYVRISVFWYFLFNNEWNPHKVKEWENQRDKAILKLLHRFPKLKFIFYQEGCLQWWHKMGLPKDRVLYWDIDWGMEKDQFEEIRQSLIEKGIKASHRFPTESSYSDLCQMILDDMD